MWFLSLSYTAIFTNFPIQRLVLETSLRVKFPSSSQRGGKSRTSFMPVPAFINFTGTDVHFPVLWRHALKLTNTLRVGLSARAPWSKSARQKRNLSHSLHHTVCFPSYIRRASIERGFSSFLMSISRVLAKSCVCVGCLCRRLCKRVDFEVRTKSRRIAGFYRPFLEARVGMLGVMQPAWCAIDAVKSLKILSLGILIPACVLLDASSHQRNCCLNTQVANVP